MGGKEKSDANNNKLRKEYNLKSIRNIKFPNTFILYHSFFQKVYLSWSQRLRFQILLNHIY